MPVVLGEAMAAGVPVIASDLGGAEKLASRASDGPAETLGLSHIGGAYLSILRSAADV